MSSEPVSSEPGIVGLRYTRRVTLAGIALAVAAPLFIATRLEPSSSGLGTHQQLGLPPCTTRIVWGIPCPSCGMTTSWAHFVRGRFIDAARVNLAGMLLAVFACGAVLTAAYGAVFDRVPPSRWLVPAAWGFIGILGVAVVQWAWRLGFS